ncbi:MAG: NADH-quinone oxidoreductase subunit H [Pseudomonadota bacterium]
MTAFFTQTAFGNGLLIAGQVLLILLPLLFALGVFMYADRKVWMAVQLQRAPTVLSVADLMQSLADLLKSAREGVVIPTGADRTVFLLAPVVSLQTALIVWAVIPFNEGWILADVNIAAFYVFAVLTLGVYGVILGGWASRKEHPLLGALQSAAQMISYQVSLGLIIIAVILSTGAGSFTGIVDAQAGPGGILSWYVLPHFPMLLPFFISALAVTNRPPFDRPAARLDLTAGYKVEYGPMPGLLFVVGELSAVVLMCALVALLFLGGWLSPLPFLPDGFFWMFLKMLVVFACFSAVRAIAPTYPAQEFMFLGWKVFVPLTLFWVVFVAFAAKFEWFWGIYARWSA